MCWIVGLLSNYTTWKYTVVVYLKVESPWFGLTDRNEAFDAWALSLCLREISNPAECREPPFSFNPLLHAPILLSLVNFHNCKTVLIFISWSILIDFWIHFIMNYVILSKKSNTYPQLWYLNILFFFRFNSSCILNCIRTLFLIII